MSDTINAAQLFLILKHLSGSKQKPFGTHAIFFYHRLEPRNLKPTSIQVLAICYEVAPVNIVKPTIGVHTPYPLHSDYRVKGAIKSLHDLFAHRGIHFT